MKWKTFCRVFGIIVFTIGAEHCGNNSFSSQSISDSSSTPIPKIDSITPALSASSGGSIVEIKGTDFVPSATVYFINQSSQGSNSVESKMVNFISSSSLKVLVPPMIGVQDFVAVQVTNHSDQGDAGSTLYKSFSYYPSSLELAPNLANIVASTSLVLAVDLMGNGKITLISTQANAQPPSTDLGAFDFDPTAQQFHGATFYSTKETLTSLKNADLNGDGKQDLIAGTASGTVLLFLNDGTGKLSVPRSFQTAVINPVRFLLPGDYDKDGNMDVVIGVGDYICSLINDGKGSFTWSKTRFAGTNFSSPVAIDYDQDGYLDVLDISNDQIYFLRSNKDGSFLSPTLIDIAPMAKNLAVGDFNVDQKLDLLVTTNNGSVNANIFLAKDGAFTIQTQIQIPNAPTSSFVGDFNGDHLPDVVIGQNTGAVSILLGNGDGSLQNPKTFAGPQSSSIISIADFDHDRKPDVLVYSASVAPSIGLLLNISQ